MFNIDKASLLHKLFPTEIPDLLEFIAEMADVLIREQERCRKSWDVPIIDFEIWLESANQMKRRIALMKGAMIASSGIFAEQLFEGLFALFTAHCLITYVTNRQHLNPKFTQAVHLFFNV